MGKGRRRKQAWDCVNCGARVEGSLGVCWNCGATPDGRVDPAFVREADVATLPPGWVSRIRCQACGFYGKVLLGHYGYHWWMVPFFLAMVLVLIAYGYRWRSAPWPIALASTLGALAPGWILFILLGNLRYRACPQCGEREQLLDYDGAEGEPTRKAERIWRTRQEADDRAFRTNKRLLLIGSLVALAVSLVLNIPYLL
jgi:hypothetical protein